jgi:hypothetical protein
MARIDEGAKNEIGVLKHEMDRTHPGARRSMVPT